MNKINLTQRILENTIKSGYVFVRCIPHTGFSLRNNETAIDIEIRKIMRSKGKPSLTKSSANTEGYPSASTSLIGQKTATYGFVGYGLINPDWNDVVSVAEQNAGTGSHKKSGSSSNNLKSEVIALKKFVDMGGNTKANNEVEININSKSPISFVFGYPQKEIYALYFKEKFKNYMGIDLPVFTYTKDNYPKLYNVTSEDIARTVLSNRDNIDFIVTMFEYYKDNAKIINQLNSVISADRLVSYLDKNLHVANFINAVKLANKLNIPINDTFKEKVNKFIMNLDRFSSFDKQNKAFKINYSNKKVDEIIGLFKGDKNLFTNLKLDNRKASLTL